MTACAKIALLWRGKSAEWAGRFHEARQWPIIEAIQSMGSTARPVLYTDDAVSAVRDELLSFDAVLVWVNPLDPSGDRSILNGMLRDVAASGAVVSALPEVIAKMGVKEVLYTTRSIGWGSDVHQFRDAASLRAFFPQHLVAGSRVLKPNHGNGGKDVWRVELCDPGSSSSQTDASVNVLEASRDSRSERVSLASFLDRWVPYLDDGGVLIDQAYQPRLAEGMVRCYMCGRHVVGFGHQLITALMAQSPADAGAPIPPPAPRIMFGPEVSRFETLREAMEMQWVPEMQHLLAIADHELPLLWDADFLLREGENAGASQYVLCEINASSVAPFPESAVAPVAAAAIDRADAARARRECSTAR